MSEEHKLNLHNKELITALCDQFGVSAYALSLNHEIVYEYHPSTNGIYHLLQDKSAIENLFTKETCERGLIEVMGKNTARHFIDEFGLGVLTIPMLNSNSECQGILILHGFVTQESWQVQFQNLFRTLKQRYSKELDELHRVNALKASTIHKLGQVLLEVNREDEKIKNFSQPGKSDSEKSDFYGMIGNSTPMKKLYDQISKVSDNNSPVIIEGESGTGKELVARAIVSCSLRKKQAFISVNCAALNKNILESELFGHKKGAFTGATQNRDGLFLTADNGTLFLDEIAEASPELQVKLLRVIQYGTFIPLGETQERKVDVRVLVATHKDLKKLVKQGLFREDLYYRLCVINLQLPPLRKRKADIKKLSQFFIQRHAEQEGGEVFSLPKNILNSLERYDWPGNVRQLQNEIKRLCVLSNGKELDPKFLSSELKQTISKTINIHRTIKDELAEVERDKIIKGLEKTGNNITKLAREMGISRGKLLRKMETLGIENSGKKVS